ncbi:MAG: hypothetical protein ACOYT8_00110 [Candidatus Dependentiae bacterium]
MKNYVALFLFVISFVHAQEPLHFCTASDSRYFNCLINLIGCLHKHNFDQIGTIAVFDLGMTAEQKEHVSRIAKVSIHDVEKVHPDIITPMQTTHWGKMVPGWYAWKAVIIKQALDMVDCVLYIDAGTTIYKPLDDLFKHIRHAGYFFHNGSPWCIQQETTQYVINKFDLASSEKKWLLDEDIKGLEAGFMGLTRRVYDSFVMPAYQLAHDLRNFADDGSCRGGFGNCRHDIPIFSMIALLNGLTIYHHFKQPCQTLWLDTDEGKIPFHIACNPQDRTSQTHVYCSRMDVSGIQENIQAIRLK